MNVKRQVREFPLYLSRAHVPFVVASWMMGCTGAICVNSKAYWCSSRHSILLIQTGCELFARKSQRL